MQKILYRKDDTKNSYVKTLAFFCKICHNKIVAEMVELVDTRDLKSLGCKSCAGSIPVFGKVIDRFWAVFFFGAAMYSDTHFHFKILHEDKSISRKEILQKMAENGCQFALDIGTRAGDLPQRLELFREVLSEIEEGVRQKIEGFIYFSAGIWPDPDSIKNREETLSALEKNIIWARNGAIGRRLVALGECGLDHHWNPAGPDNRSADDFSSDIITGERDMFERQLEMAQRLSLPVIVHSRDAAQETLDCIKNCGYNNGIIHCYSYGTEEARAFLDLGWHISFSGSVTYTKKSKFEAERELLRYVPDDRILVETDAPYLAPVPMRGHPNNPLYIEHTYKYIADCRGVSVEKLCAIVEENAARLFKTA